MDPMICSAMVSSALREVEHPELLADVLGHGGAVGHGDLALVLLGGVVHLRFVAVEVVRGVQELVPVELLVALALGLVLGLGLGGRYGVGVGEDLVVLLLPLLQDGVDLHLLLDPLLELERRQLQQLDVLDLLRGELLLEGLLLLEVEHGRGGQRAVAGRADTAGGAAGVRASASSAARSRQAARNRSYHSAPNRRVSGARRKSGRRMPRREPCPMAGRQSSARS
jgi:hypothetical protein